MPHLYRWSLLILLLTLGVGCAGAGQTTQPATQAEASSTNGEDDGDLKPYAKVITDEAESDDGLFTVHRLDEKLYFEIPDSLLDVEMLLVSRIAKTATDIGYGGEKANTQVVRWQRQDDDLLLRIVSFENVASEERPIYEAVRNANFEPIVHAFEIQSLAKDSAGVVIEATDLYTTDIDVLGLQQSRREAYKVKRLDEKRSFLVSAKSYPRNIEVRNVLTYDAGEPPSNSSSSTISLEMNHSMVLLPEDPMQPRLADQRVGFFAVEQTDYGRDTQKATERRYITRWRLECDGPRDADGLCTPKKPIVYYIDPATPEKWRPYLKEGVVDWQVAFEAAGFKDAILAKDPPSPEEDPEFSPEDVRYSVIRYFPSETENAYGPHVHDPRTGEILESDIGWFHNVMNLLRNWYFVQTAASNPKARDVEFDEEVMGELVRFVSAHEVGHTLGLPHNFGSSYAVPVDSLRSPTYTATHGTAPSIMDYARFNYVAQPEDGVTTFTPRVGEYDKWAIKWGYQPVDADSPDEEQATLNAWVKERADDPVYFYGRQTLSQIDPRSQREDLTNDAVEASRLGTANLARIVPNLVEWTYREGENYEELEELYSRAIGQWDLYLGHVVRQVGGVYETHKTYDQDGLVYAVVPEATQREAMAFLNEDAFATPEWLLDEDVLRRIEHAGALERVRDSQVDALNLLLDAQRLARLIEADARLDETYTPTEMLTDLRQGLWSELERGEAIDAFRRNLQRGYLERLHHLMTEEVEAPPARWRDIFGFTPVDVSQSDIRAYVRGELEALRREARAAIPRTSDRATVLHLRDTIARIDDILNPDD